MLAMNFAARVCKHGGNSQSAGKQPGTILLRYQTLSFLGGGRSRTGTGRQLTRSSAMYEARMTGQNSLYEDLQCEGADGVAVNAPGGVVRRSQHFRTRMKCSNVTCMGTGHTLC